MAIMRDYGDRLRFPHDDPGSYQGIIEFRRFTVAPPEVEVGNVFQFFSNYLSVSLDDQGGALDVPVSSAGSLVTTRTTYTNTYPNVTLYLPQAVVLDRKSVV